MNKDWNKDKVVQMAENRLITYSGATLCENYMTPLKKCKTPQQAIRLYKNCISWALQEKYPTKDELLSFASKETLAENGVYIDNVFNGELINGFICCVFINCSGIIKTGLNVAKDILPMLYLSDSKLEIQTDSALLSNSIPIELYYDSHVYIKDKNKHQFIIHDYTRLTPSDNIGFNTEQLEQNPDMNNDLL